MVSNPGKPMKKLLTLFTVLLTFGTQAQTNFFPSLRAGDATYENVKIESVTATNVLIFHDGGAVRVAFTNLPTFIQKQYGYDPIAIEEKIKIAKQEEAERQQANLIFASGVKMKEERPETFEQRFKIRYDKFDQDTHFTQINPIIPESDIYIYALTIAKNQERLLGFGLAFLSASRSARFMDSSDLIILSDGHRIQKSDLPDKPSMSASGISESLSTFLTPKEFKEISFSTNVEMKLGRIEMKIDYEDRRDWRLLYQHFFETNSESMSTNAATETKN